MQTINHILHRLHPSFGHITIVTVTLCNSYFSHKTQLLVGKTKDLVSDASNSCTCSGAQTASSAIVDYNFILLLFCLILHCMFSFKLLNELKCFAGKTKPREVWHARNKNCVAVTMPPDRVPVPPDLPNWGLVRDMLSELQERLLNETINAQDAALHIQVW